ncbi:hypothetical protein PAP_00270 [Palaeococcus pacificus DY20341]|uniref:Uncharacterized protein n=1 Tax=Palaeococcus pacificus DY20341 TaxID=1343739 RepID=A0A075LQU7_9EURY|nr:hypothetical protein [Palaeococcus pacificus]AIF68501.1 hypothetical protein PAP_00270 [Palaeococcus pacificus DY20341]
MLFIQWLAEEKYPIIVDAYFSTPAEFNGVQLLMSYPNEVTHVALFKFELSPDGSRYIRVEKTFDINPDYVVAEVQDKEETLYCRADWENGTFIVRDWENCSDSLTAALTRKITLQACVNGTYLGHTVERKSIVWFLFKASNTTECVSDTVEVVGRTWGIFVRIAGANGTIVCQTEKVEGTYLSDEVVTINEKGCGPKKE